MKAKKKSLIELNKDLSAVSDSNLSEFYPLSPYSPNYIISARSSSLTPSGINTK